MSYSLDGKYVLHVYREDMIFKIESQLHFKRLMNESSLLVIVNDSTLVSSVGWVLPILKKIKRDFVSVTPEGILKLSAKEFANEF